MPVQPLFEVQIKSMLVALVVVGLAFAAVTTDGAIVDYEKSGAVSDSTVFAVALKNGQILNATLNALQPGDLFLVPNKTFHLVGGIIVDTLFNVTFQLDGTLFFTDDRNTWPTHGGHVLECLQFNSLTNVTFTSSGKGTLNGNGKKWWGAIKFLENGEDRPRLFHILRSQNILFENILLKDSPFWTFWAENCDGLVVRHSEVDVRVDNADKHDIADLQAFNTDGFDITGKNVYMHDLQVSFSTFHRHLKIFSSNSLRDVVAAPTL